MGAIRSTSLLSGATTVFTENVVRGPSGLVKGRLTSASLLVSRAHQHNYDAIARLAQTKVDMSSAMTSTAFRALYDDAAAPRASTPPSTTRSGQPTP